MWTTKPIATKNGTMTLTCCLGSWRLLAPDHTEQSGPYMKALWRKAFRKFHAMHRRRGASFQRILILGIGLGGNVYLVHRAYPKAEITAVDWDTTPWTLVKKNNDIPKEPWNIVENDAEIFLERTQETYDLLVIDLFAGHNVAACLTHTSFIKNAHRILNTGGRILLNTYKDLETVEMWKRTFTALQTITYSGSRVTLLCKQTG